MGHTTLILFLLPIIVFSYSVWPQPQTLLTGLNVAEIDQKSFTISTSSTSKLLQSAISRYLNQIIFPFKSNSSSGVAYSVVVTTASDDEKLYLGVDESYELDLDTTKGTLSAKTIYGAMRGLETLSQVVDFVQGGYEIQGIPINVSDFPRFIWRGILVDTARHYLEIDAIKRQIDGLSASKMNTLHWHAVDAESFPIQSLKYPFLTAGAYAPTAIYTAQNIQDIVNYGLERGIRVVVEFDVPGHAASWGVGEPDLVVSDCSCCNANINNIPLNPASPRTLEVLQGFLAEIAPNFSDDYIHLGGDEIVTRCWLNDTKVQSWMRSKGYSSGTQIIQYFEDAIRGIVRGIDKKLVVWQDLFDNGVQLDPATIIEIWSDHETLQNVVQAGFQAITSANWYFDVGCPTWLNFYNNEPLANITITPSQEKLVIGGEACMWGEMADSGVIDGKIWPRAAAVAERLWSDRGVTDPNYAKVRLIEHDCRLKRRGINSTPIVPNYCQLP